MMHSSKSQTAGLKSAQLLGYKLRWPWVTVICTIITLLPSPSGTVTTTTSSTSTTDTNTHYNFTLAFLTSVQNSGSGKMVGGAFFFGLDHLNNVTDERLNGTGNSASFSYVFRDTRNNVVDATRTMVDLFCDDQTNITAFIGPDKFCQTSAVVATSFKLPFLSYECSDVNVLRSDIGKYLMVNLQPSLAYVAKSIVATMLHYKWNTFWLIAGSGTVHNSWADIGQYLKVLAGEKSINFKDVTRVSLNDKYHSAAANENPYPKVIRETRQKTRVYVFLGDYNSLVEFLRELNNEDVTSQGEHVVISVMEKTTLSSRKDFFLRNDERGKNGEALSESHWKAFRNVLLLRLLEPEADIGEEFRQQVYEKNYGPPINLSRIPSWWTFASTHLLRQEMFDLYDAVINYGYAVMDLIASGQNPYNASLVINYIRNTTFRSIQGFDVRINAVGESEGRYQVLSLAHNASGLVPDLVQVGTFLIGDGDPVYEPSNHTVAWVNGHVPVSDPLCGFDGSKCGGDETSELKLVAILVGLAVVVIIAIGAAVIGVRHFMYNQRLDRLAWKIEYSAIQLLDDGQLRQMISPGRPRRKVQSRWKTFLASVDMLSDAEMEKRQGSLRGAGDVQVGVYKGSHVAVRHVSKRHVEVNRALKKALLARKEMNHENINRFIGACIEPPRVYIITQFCSRRSLQDILKNEDSPLDDMFITSLVQDLVRGMTFIHESEFGYHGNLRSSKCLVDSRWVLKIADFGLRPLAVPDVSEPSLEDEGYCRKLMWRAPELLKEGTPPPEGTQRGDVYSFGVILYELYGRKGPWGDTHLNCSEILRRLRAEDYASQPGVRPFRPDTSVLRVKEGVVPLMHVCWHPDPDQRPDFKNGIRLKLKPIQQGLLKTNIFDNMLAMMEKHAHNLEAVVMERTEQLSLEKRMTENLLLRMLPRSVADKLKHGQPVCPEQYEQVSIYFSDIVGFTELSAQSTPMQIVEILNDLYTCFDSIIENYDVYKVETIGDAYMVVSGLPIRNGLSHAGEIASMSLYLLSAISTIRIRHRPDTSIKIRIGIHSGSCCAGVVGLKMPRYCLFGDTVNTASRLETTGESMKIHCSQELKAMLDMLGGYHLVERGLVDMKGKGKKLTYFLVGEDRSQRMRRISHERMKEEREQRCVSVSNMDYRGKIYTMQNGMARDLTRVPEHPDPRGLGNPDSQKHNSLVPSKSSVSSDSDTLLSAGSASGVRSSMGDVPSYHTQPSLSSFSSGQSDISNQTMVTNSSTGSTFTPNDPIHTPTPTAHCVNMNDYSSVNGAAVVSAHGVTNGQSVPSVLVSADNPQTHQGGCEEPSEMRCLLDDSRTKVTPPTRQLSHLLHGRTPETVL